MPPPPIDKSKARDIQKYVAATIQATWSYPETVGIPDPEDRPVSELRPRFYARSDDSDVETGSVAATAISTGTGSLFRPTLSASGTAIADETSFGAPYTPSVAGMSSISISTTASATMAIGRPRSPRRRRECKVLQEMEWNVGLSTWTRRRDAWTGALTPAEADPTASEPESEASEAVDESEIEDGEDVPRSARPPIPSDQLQIKSFAPGAPRYRSVRAPRRRHIPRHERLPLFVPIRPMLPATVPARPDFGPDSLSYLFETVVQRNRRPIFPLPLGTIIAAAVRGWAESGEWPGLASLLREEAEVAAASVASRTATAQSSMAAEGSTPTPGLATPTPGLATEPTPMLASPPSSKSSPLSPSSSRQRSQQPDVLAASDSLNRLPPTDQVLSPTLHPDSVGSTATTTLWLQSRSSLRPAPTLVMAKNGKKLPPSPPATLAGGPPAATRSASAATASSSTRVASGASEKAQSPPNGAATMTGYKQGKGKSRKPKMAVSIEPAAPPFPSTPSAQLDGITTIPSATTGAGMVSNNGPTPVTAIAERPPAGFSFRTARGDGVPAPYASPMVPLPSSPFQEYQYQSINATLPPAALQAAQLAKLTAMSASSQVLASSFSPTGRVSGGQSVSSSTPSASTPSGSGVGGPSSNDRQSPPLGTYYGHARGGPISISLQDLPPVRRVNETLSPRTPRAASMEAVEAAARGEVGVGMGERAFGDVSDDIPTQTRAHRSRRTRSRSAAGRKLGLTIPGPSMSGNGQPKNRTKSRNTRGKSRGRVRSPDEPTASPAGGMGNSLAGMSLASSSSHP